MSERPPLPKIPLQADEGTMLVAFLDFFRAELLDRAWGLDDEQLSVRLAPSRLSLAGLIAHMTYVEYIWFLRRFDGEDQPEPYASMDWEADWDSEMTRGESQSGDELLAEFHAAVADSNARITAADSLEQVAKGVTEGEPHQLRWILIHMIEEYARHCGHADLIRESIDGDTAR